MEWIYRTGEISINEMRDVFNCGIGFVLVVRKSGLIPLLDSLRRCGEQCHIIGEIIPASGTQEIRFIGDKF